VSVRVVRKAAPFPADRLEHEYARFISGLLLALAVSALLWTALAAVACGAYLLLTAV
jgi:hypothetical protein